MNPVQMPLFCLYEWRRGQTPVRTPLFSVSQLLSRRAADPPWDLGIVWYSVAPLDGHTTFPDFEKLVTEFSIPLEFCFERSSAVAHSFGHVVKDDGSEAIWVHFLGETPSSKSADAPSEWLTFGFFLTWSPQETSRLQAKNTTLLLFEPPSSMRESVQDLSVSKHGKWEIFLEDPYQLLVLAFDAWFRRIDKAAWEMTDRARTIEQRVFAEASALKGNQPHVPEIDLVLAHAVAKNAIYRIEGIDAVLRSLDAALACHEKSALSARDRDVAAWEKAQTALLYRKELFHSIRLRSLSSQSRIQNIIQLSFHIQNAYDSKLAAHDSKSLKLLSLLGILFLPVSTVSTIFATPFFRPKTEAANGTGSESQGRSGVVVDPELWWLCAAALPLTITILVIWLARDCRGRRGMAPRRVRANIDALPGAELV